MKKEYIIYILCTIALISIISIITHLVLRSQTKSISPALPPTPIQPKDIELKFEDPNIYKSDSTISPNTSRPVEPANYRGLVIPSPSGNGGKGSLFYIGKSGYDGILKNIEISGSFSLGDGVPTYNSFYTIIILSPPNGTQQNFSDSTLNTSVVDEKINPWYTFDFTHSHNFLRKFDDLSVILSKNSIFLLYVFGSKTSTSQIATPAFTIYNPKILMNIHT